MNRIQKSEATVARFLLGVMGIIGCIIFPPLAIIGIIVYLYYVGFVKNK